MDEQAVREALAHLRQTHRRLDEEISVIKSESGADQLLLSRLKKRKLSLKDEIARLEDQLLPDISA